MRTYQKTDMMVINYSVKNLPIWELMEIVGEKIGSANELDMDFEYESDDVNEISILNAGKDFLLNAEVGESLRWQVDPLNLQYCELRRIN